MKSHYPHIRLILILPCIFQAKRWSETERAVYEHIKAHADEVIYTSEEYSRWCMQKRNRRLVNSSSLCIRYLTESSGGTAYTVDYARKQGLSVINIACEPQSDDE